VRAFDLWLFDGLEFNKLAWSAKETPERPVQHDGTYQSDSVEGKALAYVM